MYLLVACAGAQAVLWLLPLYQRLNPVFRAFLGTLVGSLAGYLMVDLLATDAQDYFAVFFGVAIAFGAATLFELLAWVRRRAN